MAHKNAILRHCTYSQGPISFKSNTLSKRLVHTILQAFLTNILDDIYQPNDTHLIQRCVDICCNQMIFNIIYRYSRQWRQWSNTHPPVIYGYHISRLSDPFIVGCMFGFVIYVCNGQSQFEINGIKCENNIY